MNVLTKIRCDKKKIRFRKIHNLAIAFTFFVTVQILSTCLPNYVWAKSTHLIPQHQNVEVKVYHLKGNENSVIWLNPEFVEENKETWRKKIWQSEGYIIPTESEWHLVDQNDQKTWSASRYGGDGIGYNEGDGRAASDDDGEYQSKGLGATPLVRETEDHSDGKMGLEEALREALWGEILNKILPLGANRVVVIIDRGTFSLDRNGNLRRNVIVIRKKPLRPAHFMMLENATSKSGYLKESRKELENAFKLFIEATQTAPEKLKKGNNSAWTLYQNAMRVLTKRMAIQMAAIYAFQFHQGGLSPSNIEISGRILDYGAFSAQNGLGQLYVLAGEAPAGDMFDMKKNLVFSVATDIFNRFHHIIDVSTVQLKKFKLELNQIFETKYNEIVNETLLYRMGFEVNQTKKLLKTLEGQLFVATLLKIANFGSEYVSAKDPNIRPTSTYDFIHVLEVFLDAVLHAENMWLNPTHDELFNQALDLPFLREELDENFYYAIKALGVKNLKQAKNLISKLKQNLITRKFNVEVVQRRIMMDNSIAAAAQYEKDLDQKGLDHYIKTNIEKVFNTNKKPKIFSCRSLFLIL